MPEAVANTGPILHLQEIGRLNALTAVVPLLLPDLVAEELDLRGAGIARLREAGIPFTVSTVETPVWRDVLRNVAPHIQPADAQVFALVRASRYQALALTDDLALRRLLENHQAAVTGTVGLLIRSYSQHTLSRDELETALDELFRLSSLHLSRAFRTYLGKLLEDLP